MRLPRMPFLLVTVSLLIVTEMAYAECTWVLWEHTWKDSSRNQWTPTGAVETRAECEKGQAAMERQHRQLTELLIKTNPTKYDSSEHVIHHHPLGVVTALRSEAPLWKMPISMLMLDSLLPRLRNYLMGGLSLRDQLARR